MKVSLPRFSLIFASFVAATSQSDQYFLPEMNGKLIRGNFFYGYQLCKQNGLLLATPDTEKKNKDMITFMENNSIARAWISATDLAEAGKFVWMTNARPVNYTYWHEGQPDHFNGEHCGELSYVYDLLKWNDIGCHERNVVICEEVGITIVDI